MTNRTKTLKNNSVQILLDSLPLKAVQFSQRVEVPANGSRMQAHICNTADEMDIQPNHF